MITSLTFVKKQAEEHLLWQISYCHLVWICHSRANNNKINRLRERCLRIVYNDTQSSFNELLEKDGSASIHIQNIEILATEMYKPISNLSPPVMKRVSKLNRDSHYNLRQNFTILQTFGKIGISRDREYFLPWSKKYGIYYLMIIKTQKIWSLLKLRLRNGNHNKFRVGYV